MTTDYRDERVLSSFEPLAVEGLDWVILSEMDVDEAFAPIRAFARKIVLWSAVLSLAIFGFSWLVARRFVEPIVELERCRAAGLPRATTMFTFGFAVDDELGRLTGGFNRMVLAIRRQTAELTRSNEELQGVKSVILRWGPDGAIRFINDFGCEHFGFGSRTSSSDNPCSEPSSKRSEEAKASIRR